MYEKSVIVPGVGEQSISIPNTERAPWCLRGGVYSVPCDADVDADADRCFGLPAWDNRETLS